MPVYGYAATDINGATPAEEAAATAAEQTALNSALVNKVHQLESRLSKFADDSAPLEDVVTDEALKETVR
jgi:hypothetical protein